MSTAAEGGPLLERDALLERLGQALAAAAAGRGSLTLVLGEPGVGKSRLLAESVDLAGQAGTRLLSAHGGELEGGVSFGVIRELLGPPLRAADEEERARLLRGAAALALPVLGESEADNEELFPRLHGLFWLTQNLAERSPLTLLVDDLHWADAASLQALLYLFQRLDDLPVCVIAAMRSNEPGTHAGLVGEIRGFRGAASIDVEPLSPDAVGALVGSLLGPAEQGFVDACAEATGGNPFLVGELAAEMRDEGIAPLAEETGRLEHLAPQQVTNALLGRIADLGPDAVALTRAIAVLGDETPMRRAAALAEIEVSDAARRADALADAAILTPAELLSFVHPLVRSSIFADIGPDESAELGRRGAQLLRDDGEASERIAALLVRVPAAADEEAAEMLLEGGSSALHQADPHSAVPMLERALAEPPSGELRLRVLRELGRAELAAGVDTAADRLGEAAAASEGTAEHASDLQALGRALFAGGRHGEAARAFERARDLVIDSDPELGGQLDAEYIAAAFWDADLAEVGLARARELTGPDPSRPLTLADRDLLVTIAAQKMFAVEDREESLELALQAMGENDELALEEGSEGQAVHVVGGVLLAADEYERYEGFMTTAIEEARRSGSVMAFASTSYSRIAPRLELGKLAEAAADAEAAISSRRYGWSAWLPGAYALLVEVLLLRGDLERCHVALAELELDDGSPWAAVLSSARGKLAMAEGRTADARAHFQDWGDGWFGKNPAIFGDWRSFAAIASAALGERDEAIGLATEELEIARSWGAARPIAVALRSLGLATGGEEGIAVLQQAVDVLAGTEAVMERARVLTDLGAGLRSANRLEEAREPLRAALNIAHACGAKPLADRAFEELRLSGARPRRRASSGIDSLTPSEQRVARMLAEGLTAREIAEAQFVTPKAVEWHITNGCRKLGVSGREALAAAVLTETDS